MDYFKRAADMGLAKAAYNVGVMYDYGTGCDIDYKAAMEWYLKGAELGSARSMYNIGVMYSKGK